MVCIILYTRSNLRMETHTHKGFDETSSIPIPQRNPLEISQRGTNEKINTMLKFSENLIMQNIKMKKIVTGMADRIAKLEAIILNGKLQKTIEETITKREKTLADLSRRTGISRSRASETPIDSTQIPSLISKNVVEFNAATELKDIKSDPTKPNTEFNEQIRTLAEIQQMKTPGQESTQALMQNIQEQKMLTTPEVNNFVIELSSNSEEPKSDSDSSGFQSGESHASSGFQPIENQATNESHASSSATSSIVMVGPVTPPQNPIIELPSENKGTLNVANDDLVLELEPIEPPQPSKTPAPQELKGTDEPKSQDEPKDNEEPHQPKEPEVNPLVASARRRRRKP